MDKVVELVGGGSVINGAYPTLTRGCLKVHGGVPIVLCLFGDPLYTMHLIVLAAGLRWGRCSHRLHGRGVMT